MYLWITMPDPVLVWQAQLVGSQFTQEPAGSEVD